MKPPTMKEIMAMRKPFPYKEVADTLNSMSEEELVEKMDYVIGKAEIDSCNMVGIKKLYKMCNQNVQILMKKEYSSLL